jgi:hypothetical protein
VSGKSSNVFVANEQELETLVECHPYLLAAELGRRRPERQLRKGKLRLDLLFKLRIGYCIVELKKRALSHYDVRQISSYARLLQREGLKLTHNYLVGFRPVELSKLEKAIIRSPYKIRLRFLGEDFPLSVSWDKKKRKYVPYQSDHVHGGDHFQLRL